MKSSRGDPVDQQLQEIMGCTCLRMRRATRRVTQIYDRTLEPAGLTVNQFGLLAHLYGASLQGLAGWSVGTLAERLGMDPTTLNRNLKPLEARGLVADAADPADGRVRLVRITGKGERELLRAIPLWQQAQARFATALGDRTTTALNGLLDRTVARLGAAGT
jgi:DNA-binding MarR family transcriptional regulator